MSAGSTCYYWLTNNPDNQLVIWTYFRFGFLILANVGMMIFFGWNLGKLWKKKKFDWNFETSMFLLGFLAPLWRIVILINCSVYQILDVYWSFTITTLGIIYYGIILLLGIYYVLLVFEKLKPIKGLKVFFISLIILMIIFQIIIIFIMVHILSAAVREILGFCILPIIIFISLLFSLRKISFNENEEKEMKFISKQLQKCLSIVVVFLILIAIIIVIGSSMNIPLTISTCYLWGFEIIGLALFYYILTLPLYKGGVFVYIDDIILERKIGKGFFGEVWAGLWNEVPVACKKFSHLDEKDFLKEARVMKELNHPNVVRFFGIYKSIESEKFIILEYMNGGSLEKYIRENPRLSDENLIKMAFQIANGMSYLESKGIIHGDLALRNLLLSISSSDQYLVKVADFGLSNISEKGYYRQTQEKPLPVRWCAPEIFQFYTFSHKTDCWAFYVVLWELFSKGKVPYPGLTNQEIVQCILNGQKLEPPPNCHYFIIELMQRCSDISPESRPTFAEIVKSFPTKTSNLFDESWDDEKKSQHETEINKEVNPYEIAEEVIKQSKDQVLAPYFFSDEVAMTIEKNVDSKDK